jgi:N-acetylglucosaminyl-diphospho-decaprenol L-rhamnosyltransferase
VIGLSINTFTVSVVSHGHGAQVNNLLSQLINWHTPELKRVVITLNAPALDTNFFNISVTSLPFETLIIKNKHPLGFGANHNQAFAHCNSELFFVLNPDLDLIASPFTGLLKAITSDRTGCAYPVQISDEGVRLDFERTLVSPTVIAQRHILRQRDQIQVSQPVHWINGAFMAFKSSVFRELGGFDERYFMYCEDVDICLRMQLAGYGLTLADATVVHHTHRQTLKNPRHLAWHIRSLLRLWNSTPYKEYKRKFIESKA